MIDHIATVRARRLSWDVREVVRGGRGSDRVVLDLDAEWAALDRVQAVLACGGATVRVMPNGGSFTIPSQMIAATGPLRMCLVGYKGGEQRIVTQREERPLAVVECGQTGGSDPAPEQPDLWAQLMAEVGAAAKDARDAAREVREAAERGDFDGPAGPPGPRGSGISAGAHGPGGMGGSVVGDLYVNSETGELFELARID